MQGFTFTSLALVAAGGATGSVVRYITSVLAIEWLGAAFPWGTLAVNALGSLVIGALAGADVEGQARLLLVTGFLGGFTTFSAFSLQTFVLMREGEMARAGLNVGASVVLCLVCVWLGHLAAAAVNR